MKLEKIEGYLFQFLLVRLKVEYELEIEVNHLKFQFLLVRLKGLYFE